MALRSQLIAISVCVVVMFWCGVICAPIFNDGLSTDSHTSMNMKKNSCIVQGEEMICKVLDGKSAFDIFVDDGVKNSTLLAFIFGGLLSYVLLGKLKAFGDFAAHVKNVSLPAFEEGIEALKNVSTSCIAFEKKAIEILPPFEAASNALVAGSKSFDEALLFARQVVEAKFQYSILTGKGKVTMQS